MRGDLPGAAPFVFHHATAIPVGRDGWRFERTRSSIADHDQRVADPDLGWTRLPIFSRSAEHLLQELDKVPCLVSHDSWCNGVPALRGERKTVGCLIHHESP